MDEKKQNKLQKKKTKFCNHIRNRISKIEFNEYIDVQDTTYKYIMHLHTTHKHITQEEKHSCVQMCSTVLFV